MDNLKKHIGTKERMNERKKKEETYEYNNFETIITGLG